VRYVTDSGGWIAFPRAGPHGTEGLLPGRSHGYDVSKDGFGTPCGATPVAGERASSASTDATSPSALYRVTARVSIAIACSWAKARPWPNRSAAARCWAGLAFAVRYAGRLFWFWGDTSRSAIPRTFLDGGGRVRFTQGGLDPGLGVNLRYFTDPEGFSRDVAAFGSERGLIWAAPSRRCATSRAASGSSAITPTWSRSRECSGHGLAVYDDRREASNGSPRWPGHDLAFPGQAHRFATATGTPSTFTSAKCFPRARGRELRQLHHLNRTRPGPVWPPTRPDTRGCNAPGSRRRGAGPASEAGGCERSNAN